MAGEIRIVVPEDGGAWYRAAIVRRRPMLRDKVVASCPVRHSTKEAAQSCADRLPIPEGTER